MTRPPLEVADVVRQYGAAYLARYAHVTSAAQRLAVDEEGRLLVWVGPSGASPAPPPALPAPPPAPPAAPSSPGHGPPAALVPPEAERRQLTVMVCDLVDSTPSPASWIRKTSWR